MNLLLVFLGGGLGSLCRYAILVWLQPWHIRFPWATLAANGFACLIIGVLTGLAHQNNLSDPRRLLLATGFCGGLSTFSTFTNETWGLLQSGQTFYAVANIAGSLFLCFSCLLLGLKLSA
jgi:CrcB protein